MKCSCGGDIVTTNKPRDGERAGCSRCHSCISIASLIHRIDEQSDALDRAEAKIVRLYQRGSDTTSALNDERDHFCLLAQLSAAVVGDCDERIATLESQNARMKAALETLRSWDMLSPGTLSDGGWARELIDAALKESP